LVDRILAALRGIHPASSIRLFGDYVRSPGAYAILFLWAVFVLTHAWFLLTGINDDTRLLQLNAEEGIPELWEFVMLLASAGLLAIRSVQRKWYALLIPALLCLYMALDGRLQIHERAGRALWASHANAGEFLFMGAIGGLFLLSLLGAIIRSSAIRRTELTCYAILLVLFGLFGGVVDGSHALLKRFVSGSDNPMAWLEDGGELLVISMMLITSLGVFRRLGPPRQPAGTRDHRPAVAGETEPRDAEPHYAARTSQ